MTSRARLLTACIALGIAAAACGSNKAAAPAATVAPAASAVDGGFCEAMSHLIQLVAPTESSSPAEMQAAFTEARGWFEQANRAAPTSIAADVQGYTTAFAKYTDFLETVGFNLDSVYSTEEGIQLAIDTSHTLTPAIVDYTITECGLSFGDEQHEPPTTG